MTTNWEHLIKSIFSQACHMGNTIMYIWSKTIIIIGLWHRKIKKKIIFMKISLLKPFWSFLTVPCKIWRPQRSRTPWYHKGIKEFEGEIVVWTETMPFHCPLKLHLLYLFLTQNHFMPWKFKITIPNDLHHSNARTETICLSLVLMCQYILIWGLEVVQCSSHRMVPISWKASYKQLQSHSWTSTASLMNKQSLTHEYSQPHI